MPEYEGDLPLPGYEEDLRLPGYEEDLPQYGSQDPLLVTTSTGQVGSRSRSKNRSRSMQGSTKFSGLLAQLTYKLKLQKQKSYFSQDASQKYSNGMSMTDRNCL